MPFAKSARIEIESGDRPLDAANMMVDWHRCPGQEMQEKRRFCARWRREYPTAALWAGISWRWMRMGRGISSGFVCGVRLFDRTDRWSHGGYRTTSMWMGTRRRLTTCAESGERIHSGLPMEVQRIHLKRTCTRGCPTTTTRMWANPGWRTVWWRIAFTGRTAYHSSAPFISGLAA